MTNWFDGIDGDAAAFLNSLLSKTCAKCGQKADVLKPWPPDKADAPRLCGLCAMKAAVQGR